MQTGLAEHCLRVMSNKLKKNICDLISPGTLNEEIDPKTIRERILAEVEYACVNWVRHLEESLTPQAETYQLQLLERAQLFVEQSILYWSEALSLLEKLRDAIYMLSAVLALAQVSSSSITPFRR